ncbi:serine protease [Jannaschia sp. W003]|uniref:serine protease n=1 Tax=Jannaschia sp. W003 TaxID=2867012 RepID=UPI0021A7F426|nr:serine protease [Jannaschia sp. W003]UWQ21647.1 hypothetical protein K3554_01050 [Jannaschia sp. W003]
MLRPLLAALALVAAAALATAPATAQVRLDAPFDPGALDRQEVRIMQAALTLAGSYDASIDGLWGAGSREALARFQDRFGRGDVVTWDTVKRLLDAYERERRASGWQVVSRRDAGVWHLRPEAILRRDETAEDIRFATEDAGLILLVSTSPERPREIHDAVLADRQRGAEPLEREAPGLLVTGAKLRGGRNAYVRSDSYDGGARWLTHVIVADDANLARALLILSSVSREPYANLAVGPDGTLADLLGASGRAPESPVAEPGGEGFAVAAVGSVLGGLMDGSLERTERRVEQALRAEEERREAERAARERERDLALPPPAAEPERVFATGFYVNPSDILSTEPMANACRAIGVQGGPLLRRVAVGQGFAVFTADGGRSGPWLRLAPEAPAEGTPVSAVSFRPGNGALREARGRVGARRANELVDHSAVLRGNGIAGTPLIGDDGRVVGTVRPGEIDAMVGVERAVDWLRDSGIDFATDARPSAAVRGAVPEEVRGAVVTLDCRD